MKENNLPSVDENNLTEDNKKVLSETYSLTDGYHISDEEMKIAKEMFDTPEKFVILRKIFGIVTENEKGLTGMNSQALIDADSKDLTQYAIQTLINTQTEENIRKALANFYIRLQREIRTELMEGMQEQNTKDFDEVERTKEFESEEEVKKRTVGENL